MSVIIEYLQDEKQFADAFTFWATSLAEQQLIEAKLDGGEVNIVLADDQMLYRLNLEYRQRDCSTDVLSFIYYDQTDNLENEKAVFALGDIYISLDRAEIQACEAGHTVQREVALLIIHGLLHLLGYDHLDDQEAEVMQQQEKELLQSYDRIFTEEA